MPPVTVLFHELEFSQTWEFGGRRTDLPVGAVMDFLLDVIDRSIAAESTLVVGSTSHPSTLRQAFADPRRFERVVEVTPLYPDDIVAALTIHAAEAEKRAGRHAVRGHRLARGGRAAPRPAHRRLDPHPARRAAAQGAARSLRRDLDPRHHAGPAGRGRALPPGEPTPRSCPKPGTTSEPWIPGSSPAARDSSGRTSCGSRSRARTRAWSSSTS